MQITYKGNAGFTLRGNKATVALALDPRQISTEQIVITAGENDAIKAGKDQVVFDWPGEYESNGVMVMIIPVGKDRAVRVVKVILDDISIVHLDNLAEPLTEAEEEKIGNVDLLFVSIGKAAQLPAKGLQAAIEGIDPKLVIPMNYAAGEEETFAKAMGLGSTESEDSLKIKKSDLTSDKLSLAILRPRK